MMGVIRVDRRQAGILSDRYLDVLLGDPKTVLLYLFQAPLIALLIAGVWANLSSDSATLYFVLPLSAFFLGAVNSAREIVKEWPLFLRERMYNLDAAAYVVSKLRVQGILMVVASVLLTGIVSHFIPLKVHPLWVGGVLVLTSITGTTVGLMISALVEKADKAVMMVPLVVIPQILFSELVLAGGTLDNWTSWAQRIMPVHWAYRFFEEMRGAEDLWVLVSSVLVLAIIAYGSFAATVWALSRARY